MRHERFVVTTTVEGRTRNVVWDSAEPMGVGHPFRWVLERTPSGIRVRDLSGRPGEVRQDAALDIPRERIEAGDSVRVPAGRGRSELHLRIQPIGHVRPPYIMDAEAVRAAEAGPHMPQLFAYSGVRRTLVHARTIHSAYVAYARGRPVFVIYHGHDGFKIKPLLHGVRLKLKGERSVEGTPGKAWLLKDEQIPLATVVRGWSWWRFALVTPPKAPSTQGLPRLDEEGKYFRTLIGIVLACLAALSVVLWVRPKPVEEIKSALPAPQTAKLARPKLKPVPRPEEPPPEQPVARAEPAPAAPPPRAEAPAPAPKKAEAPKPAPAVQSPPPAAPPKPSAAAQQAKMLKETLGGLASLTRKSVMKPGETGAKTSSLFDAKAPSLAPGEIRPTYAGSDTKVTGVASGDAAYAGVDRDKIGKLGSRDGQGFIQMEAGDSMVEEGLTKSEVGAVIHAHLNEVRYCHEASMVINPKSAGKVVLEFRIDARGRVEKTSVQSSSLTERSLEKCLMRKLQGWQFPKPKGGASVSVSYPFLFRTFGRD
jgi:TonB family protein